jgi:hypothetical protein
MVSDHVCILCQNCREKLEQPFYHNGITLTKKLCFNPFYPSWKLFGGNRNFDYAFILWSCERGGDIPLLIYFMLLLLLWPVGLYFGLIKRSNFTLWLVYWLRFLHFTPSDFTSRTYMPIEIALTGEFHYLLQRFLLF